MYTAIVLLPLLGALIAGFFGRFIGARASEIITSTLLVISAVLSWVALYDVGLNGQDYEKPIVLFNWLTSGELDVAWSIRVDTLTVVMLVVVNTVSSLVHIYSIGYMHQVEGPGQMYTAIVLLPLLGALIAGFFGRFIGARASEIITSTLLVISAVLSWVALYDVGLNGQDYEKPIVLFNWLTSGELDVAWSIRVDTLTVVMLVVVNTVSSLVHIYSIGYMHDDPLRSRQTYIPIVNRSNKQ